jgi:hypothetical protein
MTGHSQRIDTVTISVATLGDGPELTQLLRDCYRQSSDFTIRDDSYFTNHFDGRSVVLAARSDGVLLGTMKATLISCSSDLNSEDEEMLTSELTPALFLSRAATVQHSRARGVNSLMRLFCLEAALELQLKSLVGFVYRDAPRTRLMADLGYSFTEFRASGNSVFTDHSQHLFAFLALDQCGNSAVRALRLQTAQQGGLMAWDGEAISEALLTCGK